MVEAALNAAAEQVDRVRRHRHRARPRRATAAPTPRRRASTRARATTAGSRSPSPPTSSGRRLRDGARATRRGRAARRSTPPTAGAPRTTASTSELRGVGRAPRRRRQRPSCSRRAGVPAAVVIAAARRRAQPAAAPPRAVRDRAPPGHRRPRAPVAAVPLLAGVRRWLRRPSPTLGSTTARCSARARPRRHRTGRPRGERDHRRPARRALTSVAPVSVAALAGLLFDADGADDDVLVHAGDEHVDRAALRHTAGALRDTLAAAGLVPRTPVAVMLPNGTSAHRRHLRRARRRRLLRAREPAPHTRRAREGVRVGRAIAGGHRHARPCPRRAGHPHARADGAWDVHGPADPMAGTAGDDVAFVQFTSGTTGRPEARAAAARHRARADGRRRQQAAAARRAAPGPARRCRTSSRSRCRCGPASTTCCSRSGWVRRSC